MMTFHLSDESIPTDKMVDKTTAKFFSYLPLRFVSRYLEYDPL